MTDLLDWIRSQDTPRPERDVPDDERMQPLELLTVREALGLTREALAKSLGVSLSSVESWEMGRRTIPDGVRRDVEAIEHYTAQVVDHLAHQLRQTHDEPTVMVYRADRDLPEMKPSEAPLVPTARWWRTVAYRAAETAPGTRITGPRA